MKKPSSICRLAQCPNHPRVKNRCCVSEGWYILQQERLHSETLLPWVQGSLSLELQTVAPWLDGKMKLRQILGNIYGWLMFHLSLTGCPFTSSAHAMQKAHVAIHQQTTFSLVISDNLIRDNLFIQVGKSKNKLGPRYSKSTALGRIRTYIYISTFDRKGP